VSAIEVHNLEELSAYVGKEGDTEHMLFRGQAMDWPLLPKIGRNDLKIKRNKPYNGSREETERILLRDFKRIGATLLRESLNTWDLLALAQHYCLPTRMLDWTRNPLIALWFTVCRPPRRGEDREQPGVLWLYKPNLDAFCSDDDLHSDPLEIDRVVVYEPRHLSERIINQRGVFTVHPLSSDGDFLAFSDTDVLEKVVIPAKQFCQLRYELDRFGTNEYSVFPDLSGLGNHLVYLHTLLSDEEEAHERRMANEKLFPDKRSP